jgi:hypothetical protein
VIELMLTNPEELLYGEMEMEIDGVSFAIIIKEGVNKI